MYSGRDGSLDFTARGRLRDDGSDRGHSYQNSRSAGAAAFPGSSPLYANRGLEASLNRAHRINRCNHGAEFDRRLTEVPWVAQSRELLGVGDKWRGALGVVVDEKMFT